MKSNATAVSKFSMAGRILHALERIFPVNEQAYKSPAEQTGYEVLKAAGTMGRYLSAFPAGRLARTDVLDFGCGWGGETLWLAKHVRSVCGVDVDRNAVEQAERARQSSGVHNCRFVHSTDGRLPLPSESFDAVLSTDTFEHVMDLDLAFLEIARVLRPGGSLLTRFGPLFYSPQGYHFYWACQVPYAHLLFGLQPILELRNARAGAARHAQTWRELGLNGKRFGDYLGSARRSGFDIVRFDPIAVRGATALTKLPLLKDLFIFGIDLHVRRPEVRR
jgi:SAM-dependent methyltransferase